MALRSAFRQFLAGVVVVSIYSRILEKCSSQIFILISGGGSFVTTPKLMYQTVCNDCVETAYTCGFFRVKVDTTVDRAQCNAKSWICSIEIRDMLSVLNFLLSGV